MQSSTSQETPEERTDKLILVVEDDEDTGEVLVRALSQELLCHVHLIARGLEALELVSKIKPDLFIIDYWLPDINGLQLYDQLHTKQELQNIPSIITSAGMLEHVIGHRDVTVMPKPLDLDELLMVVEKLLTPD